MNIKRSKLHKINNKKNFIFQKLKVKFRNFKHNNKPKANKIKKNFKDFIKNIENKFKKIKEKRKKKKDMKPVKIKREKEIKTNKPKKIKHTKEKKHIFVKILLRLFLVVFFSILLFVLGCAAYIIHESPEFNPDNLQRKNGTLIYDNNNNLIAVIGLEKRQKVIYDELPEVLIDAVVATEDSKFYQHNGVDFPRFIKATLLHLKGQDDAGGASTITMQLSKNSFTSTNSSGIKGIIRKFTDIYLSMFHIEREYTKEELLEFYINTPYMGSSSYGVEQASKTYFNKNVNDLSLVEAATLAGLFQSPSAYDPYIYPEKIEQRKNQVLSLMKRHGYITDEEYNAAKNITVKSILTTNNKKSTNEYQGYIDTVIQEVIDETGSNPYDEPMAIYTNLDTKKQDIINNFYKTHSFKDSTVEVGMGVIDNKTGEILAVGAGRNKNSEMSYNYATQINRHPGSTAKPLFDYGPGIEYLKWSTYKIFNDSPTTYRDGTSINNWDHRYEGMLTLKQALSESRNTCALQAFRQVENAKIKEFVTNLGITPEINPDGTIGEWHSIGAFNGVNPIQLAGAYSAFGNEGIYTKPHTINKVVFFNSQKEYKPENKKVKAMSKATAYMIAFVLQEVTDSRIFVSGTEIATKTGTSSYDDDLIRSMGLPSSTIQDSWTVTFSPDYTIAIWYGYPKLTRDRYIIMSHSNVERVNIQSEIVNKIMKSNSKFIKPDDVIIKYVGGAQHCYIKGSTASDAYTPDKFTSRVSSKKEEEVTVKKKVIINEGREDVPDDREHDSNEDDHKDTESEITPPLLEPIE